MQLSPVKNEANEQLEYLYTTTLRYLCIESIQLNANCNYNHNYSNTIIIQSNKYYYD